MQLSEVIEKIEARKKLWEEFAKKVNDYLYGHKCDYPRDILWELLGRDELHLLTDYWYDGECAWCVVSELERVLKLLREVKEK
jgi:hypothetical protein